MILTYKIEHNRNFSKELAQAKQVAEYAIKNDTISSKDVSDIGLKSIISNQILRKYGKNKKIKKVSNIKLVVPGQGVKYTHGIIWIACLDLNVPFNFPREIVKINQVEVGKNWVYVSVTIQEPKVYETKDWVGVDRNATHHCAVMGDPQINQAYKLGKKAQHIHKKYASMRKNFQKKGKYGIVKKLKNRESRIERDLNHKVSRKIVDYAKNNNCGIALEYLKGIRKIKKQAKSFKYFLNSWSHHQLGTFIEYKAKLLGVPVDYIDPAYTSQQCCICGCIGIRKGKVFTCINCGKVEDADVNASFVIALRHKGILQMPGVVINTFGMGNTDIPQLATG